LKQLDEVKLEQLSERTTADRSYLSVFCNRAADLSALEDQVRKIDKTLAKNDSGKDEHQHLMENWRNVKQFCKNHPLLNRPFAIIVNWLDDFREVIELPQSTVARVVLDSSPFIRPLAEQLDDYENSIVVVADNKKARIHLLTTGVSGDPVSLTGNIKNHVKKGGWSQQRYERRRDKELLHYAKEIIAAVQDLSQTTRVSHVLLVGGREILHIVFEQLPGVLQDKAAVSKASLDKGDKQLHTEIFEMLAQRERQSERSNWERIRTEIHRDGLGVAGIDDVYAAIINTNVDTMVVQKSFRKSGLRCRSCESLQLRQSSFCPECEGRQLFSVDLANEFNELVVQQGGVVDYVEDIPTLESAGGIAALLRYK
jgi:peptide subunit release factor 1 (eRF1)